MRGVLDLLSAVARLGQAELHVGLTGADPNIAHQHFAERYGLLASDLHRVRPARWRRIEAHLPTAIRAGDA